MTLQTLDDREIGYCELREYKCFSEKNAVSYEIYFINKRSMKMQMNNEFTCIIHGCLSDHIKNYAVSLYGGGASGLGE